MEHLSKESRKRKRGSSYSRQSSSTNPSRRQGTADTDVESGAATSATASEGSFATSSSPVTSRERSSSTTSAAAVTTKKRKSSRFFQSLYSSSTSNGKSASATTSRRSSLAQQQSCSSASLATQNPSTKNSGSNDNNNNNTASLSSTKSSIISNDKKSSSGQKSTRFFSSRKLLTKNANSSATTTSSRAVTDPKRRSGSSATVNDDDTLASPNLSTHSSGSSRQLLSLLDYFPSFESSRRLTRSLTRRLRSSVTATTEAENMATEPSSTVSVEVSKRTSSSKAEAPVDGSRSKRLSKEKDQSSAVDKPESAVPSSSREMHQPTTSKAISAKTSTQKTTTTAEYVANAGEYENSSSDSINDNAGRLQRPRMQNLLGRGQSHSGITSSSTGGRWESFLVAMQKQDDLSAQLQGLIELCNQLVMSNEESVGTNFPIKEMVRCLIKLLQVEHNFDIMTHACRALTYLMEALPRVTVHVTDAIPYLLEKLQRVECIDVAEQALAALELLSRRHGKNILNAGGISACLQYIDFFSTSSQRSALQIVANCCLHMSGDDFGHLGESLPALSQRLASQDKKTVEILCQVFTRLVDNYVNDAERLKRISDFGLLENVQQLMVMTPPLLSSNALCSVIRMLQLFCRQSSEIAARLLQMNIVTSLCILLIGTVDPQTNSELLARTSQELYELVLLIGELWPSLPNDGLFEVDAWLKSTSLSNEHILWTWRDEKGLWRPYTHIDNRILETAYQSKEEEVSLSSSGQTYTIDLLNMLQINEETGHSQPVQRRVASTISPSAKKTGSCKQATSNSPGVVDARTQLLRTQPKLYDDFFRNTFSVLYEVYTTGGGPAVRTECLRTLLRMIYHTDAETTKDVLKKHSISSLIAGILNSQDIKTVVPALQLSRILVEKQQEIFTVHFKREGVTHQLHRLSMGNVQFNASPASNAVPLATASHSLVPPSSYIVVTNSTGSSSNVGYQQHHYIQSAVATGIGATSQAMIPGSSTVYSNHDLTYYAAAAAAAAAAVGVSVSGHGISSQPVTSSSLGLNAFASTGTLPPLTHTYFTHQPASSSGVITKRLSAATATDAAEQFRAKATHYSGKKRGLISSSNAPSSHTKHATTDDKTKSSRIRSRTVSYENPTSKIAATQNASITQQSSHISNQFVQLQQSNQATTSSSGANTFLSSSFLSNLSLPRWAKPATYARQGANSYTSKTTAGNQLPPASAASAAASSSMAQSVASNCFNMVKATSWVKEQASSLLNKYFPAGESSQGAENNEEILLNKLCDISKALRKGEIECFDDLTLTLSSGVSCFEILQSDIVPALVEFLTKETVESAVDRNDRIRHACEALFRAKVELNSEGVPVASLTNDQSLARNFVQKLSTCVSQLEQLPIKVHDFAFGQSGGALRGLNALRFLHTQQIKCLLQRHPEEKSLRQWRRGPIKVDPLAQISTIERYLVTRGFGRAKSTSNEEVLSEDDNDSSGEDSDETTVRQSSAETADGMHRLQLSISDRALPSDLSVYQAIRQFGSRLTDHADWLGPEIWVNTHTIFYRLAPEAKSENLLVDSKSKPTGTKNRAKDKAHLKPVLDPKDIELKPSVNPLSPYIVSKLPVDASDPSFECLNLLRILFNLSRFWFIAFNEALISDYSPALMIADFYNAKIAGKISRQLQDPLMLIAGQIPTWIEQLMLSCPFLCTFEIRMALFHVLALDRDRALQRLLDSFFDTSHASTSERLTPRLERRKMIISREDILRQAETVLNNIENSRAVLEVQYENEVGTGLGPTLEFYALVSKNLQRSTLQLWRGENVKKKEENNDMFEEYTSSQRGLYPLALGRHVKQGQLDKIKTKFKLIGKLLSRALLDGRILDLPLSTLFYKWLLKDEASINISDLSELDPGLSKSLQYLIGLMCKSRFGGCKYLEAKAAIESLELDFTVPGNPSMELIKGGKDTLVTVENVQQYVDLLIFWLLRAGVSRQMEIMRDAFDSVLSLKHLKLFLPEEMDQLFCGAKNDVEPWDPSMLRQTIHPDHGYNHDSPQINWLIQILSEYDEEHRRMFLQFITGSPRLPVGGLKNLNPPFTAVRKHDGGNAADSHLPSVMTCVNYLKLPEYSSKQIMAQRLLTAITCGCFSFHLS